MKRCCARLVGLALLFFFIWNVSPVIASDKAVADSNDSPVGRILDLLKEKKIISNEESAAFIRQMVYKTLAREDLKALVDLLRAKGVVTGEEAASFIQNVAGTPLSEEGKGSVAQAPAARVQETNQLVLPAGDKEFIRQLRELWVKKGNRRVDFDTQLGDIADVKEIIDRMRVIGVITPAYATKLDEFYRKKYLSGAVTTVMENKEQDYIDQIRKNTAWEIDEKIKNILKDEWWQNIHLSGDFRLRYEGDFFDKNNGIYILPTDPTETQTINTTVNRDRVRLRARLGVDAKLFDGLEAGVGLATGTTSNPSPNVTLGDSSQNKSIVLNKAFLKWNPIPSLTFWGGRFVNPWFYTDLVWYPDLNFDGIAIQYKPQPSPVWSPFLTAGAFPIQEIEISARDKWLFGGQLGVQYKPSENLRAKLGVAYYRYENTQGMIDPTQTGSTDFTAPLFQQKGNTLMDLTTVNPVTGAITAHKSAYASKFRELNITGQLDLGYWDPVHVIFTGDFVKNLAFDRNELEALDGLFNNVKPGSIGYQLAVTVGHPFIEAFGDWKAWFSYKRLESDAVMDAFTDQDFHLGGTNAKGWIIGGEFGLTKNVWLTSRWLSTDAITGNPFAVDLFFFDVNAKF